MEQKSVNQAFVPTRLVCKQASLVFAFLLSATRTHFLVDDVLSDASDTNDLGISVGERRSGRRLNVKARAGHVRAGEGDPSHFVTLVAGVLPL